MQNINKLTGRKINLYNQNNINNTNSSISNEDAHEDKINLLNSSIGGCVDSKKQPGYLSLANSGVFGSTMQHAN